MKHNRIATAATLTIFAVAGGLTSAQALTSTKTLHACAAKHTGALRLAAHCKASETPVAWNQAGVQGPRGVPGMAGKQGIQGKAGKDGTASVAAYSNSSRDTNSRPVVTEGQADVVVGSLTIPAGSFSVNAFATFYDTATDPMLACRLRAPIHGTGLYYSPTVFTTIFGTAQETFADLSVSSVLTAPAGGSLDLVCTTGVASSVQPPSTEEWDITATSVDSVNGTSSPLEGFL